MLLKAEARRAARASDEVEIGQGGTGDVEEDSGSEDAPWEEVGWGDEEMDEKPEMWGGQDAVVSDGGEDDRLEAYQLSSDEDDEGAPNGHAAVLASKKRPTANRSAKIQQKRTISAPPHGKRVQKKHKAH